MKAILDSFKQLQCHGVDLMVAIHASKTPHEQLANDLRMTVKEIERLNWLAMQFSHIYHRKLARSLGLSIKQLELIATGVNKCSNPLTNKLKLREEFIRAAGTLSTQELKTTITMRLKQLNRGHSKRRKSTLGCSNHPDQDGMGHLHAKLPFPLIRHIHIALHARAQNIRHNQPKLAYDEALAMAFEQCFSGSKKEGMLYQPAFLYALNNGEILHEDGTVTTTNGCQEKLESILNNRLAPYGYVIAYALDTHGVAQPIATYRIQRQPGVEKQSRHATWLQRFHATIENPVCTHPDCARPAANCDMHHITAWSNGGPTVLDNLAPLCRPHNARNDDNPNQHKNGRITRDTTTGRKGFQLRPDEPIRYNQHPTNQKSAREWAIAAFSQ